MIEKINNATTISFLGMKGRGKTVGSSILVNNIENKNIIIFDPVGAYTDKMLIDKAKYINVDIKKFDKDILYKILQKFKETDRLVLNLSSLNSEELVAFTDEMMKVIDEVGNISWVFDEIGDVVPQNQGKYSRETERSVRVGRNFGVKPVIMISQRTQKVDKNVLALSDYYIVLNLSHNLDLKAIQELVGFDTQEFKSIRKDIKNLQIGEFFLISSNGEIEKGKFNIEKQRIDPIQWEQPKENFENRISELKKKINGVKNGN